MTDPSWREGYPSLSYDKVRYADTDRQGHVNNAHFATFLETGRVEFLYDPECPLYGPHHEFVLVSIQLDLEGEIRWPGRVDIGTRVARIGTSSVTVEQALYQDDQRVASAKTVIVQIDRESRRPAPLAPETVARLEELTGRSS